jgi:outer membrane protein assembly factor BamA
MIRKINKILIFIFILSLCLSCYESILFANELTIKTIEISGNSHFTDTEIVRALGLHPEEEFSYEKLNRNIENVLHLYFSNGFYLTKLSPPEVIPSDDGKGVSIKLIIDEGHRLLIKDITFRGNKYFSREKLRTYLSMHKNSPFSIQKANSDMKMITTIYSEKGYPFCKVSLDSMRIKKDSLFLNYDIQENELVHISDIIFSGNTVTKEKTLELLLNFQENEIYDSRKIERAKHNLLHKKYIESVEIIPLNNWQIMVTIKEKSMNRFQGVLGLASSKEDIPFAERLTGFIDFSFLNILGTDREVQFKWNKLTSKSSEFYISYREPFILAQQISAEASLRRKTVDTTYVNTDLQVSSFFTMKNYNKIGLQYTYSSSLEDTVSIDRNGVGAIVEINKLDYPINPRKGYKNTTNYTIRWRSKQSYDQLISEEVEVVIPLNYYNVFYIKGLTKLIFTKNDTLSTYDKYSFGGYESLRGFVDNQFIAAKFGIISFEYRYLLSRDSRAFAFVDYGYCEEYKSLIGVGFGVRLKSKIGIIKIDYGIGYQDGTWTNPLQGTVHFGLETGF